MSSTRLGSHLPRLSVVFSSRSKSHSLASSGLRRRNREGERGRRRQSSPSPSSSFMTSSKSLSQTKRAPFFFMRRQSPKGCRKVSAISSSQTFSSRFLELALMSYTANFSRPKAKSWLRLLSSTFTMSPPNSQSPIFLAAKSKRETWDLPRAALPKRSYISWAAGSLKVRMRSKGWSLMESNLAPPMISLFLISFFLSSAKGHQRKMCFLSSSSQSSLRMKRMLPSAATMEESTSILYSSLRTAFLATSLSCAKSQTSILLCFSTWYSLSTSLLMVASSIRQAWVSLMRMIFLMTSLGKLWIVASCSLLHTTTHLFSKLTPTSPSPDTYRFSTGYSSELAQRTGTELESSFHRLTPLSERLQYQLGALGAVRTVMRLKCSCSLVKVPSSLPPFLEQRTTLVPLISQQVSWSMSTTQLSSLMRLQRSSRRRCGSTSSIWLEPRQQRQTLGVASMDWMMASSRRLSSHSSYSGR